jgi:CPA1 family monovalent cation:H+ antiporter
MELVIIIVVFAIIASSIIHNVFPKIPLNLLQICFGAVLGGLSIHHQIQFEPEIFLLIVIAPLLFREAEETDILQLWRVKKHIFFMVFVLVFLLVAAIGLSLHWMLPVLSLPICFAVGAILGPTDLIAVQSLSGKIKINSRVMNILKGEGLINDASGLTALHFAILTFLTGTFSWLAAGKEMLIMVIGGCLVGFLIGTIKRRITRYLHVLDFDHVQTYVLVDILVPFLAYIAAELLGLSGILAVVVAGAMQAIELKRRGILEAEYRESKHNIWEIIKFVLNSMVFILLGLQLPDIVTSVLNNPDYAHILDYIWLVIVAVLVIMIVVRFASSFIFSATILGKGFKEKARNAAVLTISGVKGTVSLAAAFSLPLFYQDGTLFAERPLLLFIVAAVIIIYLILALILLPIIAESEDEPVTTINHQLNVTREVCDMLAADSTLKSALSVYLARLRKLEYDKMSVEHRHEIDKLRSHLYDVELDFMEKSLKSNNQQTPHIYRQFTALLGMVYHQRIYYRLATRIRHTLGRIRLVRKKSAKRLTMLQQFDFMKVQKLFKRSGASVEAELKKLLQDKTYPASVIDYVAAERQDYASEVAGGTHQSVFVAKRYLVYSEQLLRAYSMERRIIHRFRKEGKLTQLESTELLIRVNQLESHALSLGQNDDTVRRFLHDVVDGMK